MEEEKKDQKAKKSSLFAEIKKGISKLFGKLYKGKEQEKPTSFFKEVDLKEEKFECLKEEAEKIKAAKLTPETHKNLIKNCNNEFMIQIAEEWSTYLSERAKYFMNKLDELRKEEKEDFKVDNSKEIKATIETLKMIQRRLKEAGADIVMFKEKELFAPESELSRGGKPIKLSSEKLDNIKKIGKQAENLEQTEKLQKDQEKDEARKKFLEEQNEEIRVEEEIKVEKEKEEVPEKEIIIPREISEKELNQEKEEPSLIDEVISGEVKRNQEKLRENEIIAAAWSRALGFQKQQEILSKEIEAIDLRLNNPETLELTGESLEKEIQRLTYIKEQKQQEIEELDRKIEFESPKFMQMKKPIFDEIAKAKYEDFKEKLANMTDSQLVGEKKAYNDRYIRWLCYEKDCSVSDIIDKINENIKKHNEDLLKEGGEEALTRAGKYYVDKLPINFYELNRDDFQTYIKNEPSVDWVAYAIQEEAMKRYNQKTEELRQERERQIQLKKEKAEREAKIRRAENFQKKITYAYGAATGYGTMTIDQIIEFMDELDKEPKLKKKFLEDTKKELENLIEYKYKRQNRINKLGQSDPVVDDLERENFELQNRPMRRVGEEEFSKKYPEAERQIKLNEAIIEQRPLGENPIKDEKELQKDHSKARKELAEKNKRERYLEAIKEQERAERRAMRSSRQGRRR